MPSPSPHPAQGRGIPLRGSEVRSLAISQSNTLKKALLSVDSALLEEKLQSYSRLPSLSANAGAGLSYPQASLPGSLGASAGITVSQTIYSGGKSALAAAIDSLSTQAARQQARSEYFTVLQKADDAFSAVIEAQSSVAAAAGDLQAARTHQSLAEAMLEAGTTTRASYLKTEAETAAAETSADRGPRAAFGCLRPAVRPDGSATAHEPGRSGYRHHYGAQAEIGRFFLIANGSAHRRGPIRGVREQSFPHPGQSGPGTGPEQLPVGQDRLPSQPQRGLVQHLAVFRRPGCGDRLPVRSVHPSPWISGSPKQGPTPRTSRCGRPISTSGRRAVLLDLEVQGTVYDLISSSRAVSSSSKALDYAESHYEGVLEQFRLSAASSSDLSDAQALVSTNRKLLISARARFLTNLSTLRTLAGLETDDLLLRIMP